MFRNFKKCKQNKDILDAIMRFFSPFLATGTYVPPIGILIAG
jgi:hypothetical protein